MRAAGTARRIGLGSVLLEVLRMANIEKRPNGVWRARYYDSAGRQHARHFKRKIDAKKWLDDVTAAVVTGNYVDPKVARTTVSDWCDAWLIGYGTRRKSTVRQAAVHVKVIKAHFGSTPLSSVKPSDVKAWTVALGERYAPSTTYATYRRFAQIMSDAVHDGILVKSPCSRRTSPPQAKQRPHVASTQQVWALHDAMPAHLRVAILLGAFVGLRVSEAAALRVEDVDYMRGVVKPQVQLPEGAVEVGYEHDASADACRAGAAALSEPRSVRRHHGRHQRRRAADDSVRNRTRDPGSPGRCRRPS